MTSTVSAVSTTSTKFKSCFLCSILPEANNEKKRALKDTSWKCFEDINELEHFQEEKQEQDQQQQENTSSQSETKKHNQSSVVEFVKVASNHFPAMLLDSYSAEDQAKIKNGDVGFENVKRFFVPSEIVYEQPKNEDGSIGSKGPTRRNGDCCKNCKGTLHRVTLRTCSCDICQQHISSESHLRCANDSCDFDICDTCSNEVIDTQLEDLKESLQDMPRSQRMRTVEPILRNKIASLNSSPESHRVADMIIEHFDAPDIVQFISSPPRLAQLIEQAMEALSSGYESQGRRYEEEDDDDDDY